MTTQPKTLEEHRNASMTATESLKHPETAGLAIAALSASGCKTHQEFCDLFGGAIGLRTLRSWLKGDQPAHPIARLMLGEFIAGWRPTCLKAGDA